MCSARDPLAWHRSYPGVRSPRAVVDLAAELIASARRGWEHSPRIEIDREITARMTLPPAWSLIHTLREAAPYELSSD
jgi:hypothetical protein